MDVGLDYKKKKLIFYTVDFRFYETAEATFPKLLPSHSIRKKVSYDITFCVYQIINIKNQLKEKLRKTSRTNVSYLHNII